MTDEELKNLPKEKFVLVNENKKLRDKELVTKPVGFFMDAMHRFAKNKGSIVGAIVIGVLVLYAIIAPIISPYTVSYNDTYYRYVLPKLFNNENIDFLDGATNKTLNEATFIYYYSMGVETHHNSIKRQEYKKNEDTNMYSFRLDSYQSVGNVFKNVSSQEYARIQEYQDENNVQIIYPITDVSKRPAAKQDTGNANYWYETELNGSISAPINYTVNEDGTITYSDIYLPYIASSFSSSKSVKDACYVKVNKNSAGKYIIQLLQKNIVEDENGEKKTEVVDIGFITIGRRSDSDFAYLEADKEDASGFEFDTVNQTFVLSSTGHVDASKDGNYIFALNAASGSTANLVSEDKLSSSDYIPLKLYDLDNNLTNPSEDPETLYNFGGIRYGTANEQSVYVSGLTNEGAGISSGSDKAASLVFTDNGSGGFTLKTSQKPVKYLAFSVTGNDANIVGASMANASEFKFDASKKAIYTEINTFADASLNGTYYVACHVDFASDSNQSNVSSLLLAKEADIDADLYTDYMKVYNTVSFENPVDEVTSGESYRLFGKIGQLTQSFYCLDGNFTGDNYFSKMRIEGENEYLYSYAIAKKGGFYEVRINYYEYYRFYHKAILHDRISEPYFLFGTTNYGQDIFTCLASGARFSFIMAIIVALVNMIVGAIYGALEGYYGGKVDLIMERIVEILSAVPFMIVITLLKYHMGRSSQALILFIAFFLTGWIGMSGTVRMQFYRFKNQEYVLASRTLGAKDPRIMFKHIFPNALGTIITSCVLIIPSMIFSETSLSYLGIINLNSGNMTSVGTLLAAGQPFLVSYPHMILFPAIFISLLMLCFNLFGNGLRDAFNPSLRGTED